MADNDSQQPQAPEFITLGSKYLTLAQNLEAMQRHPVLIFGSSAAGKTQLIISLIQCLQRSGIVDVTLGEPIFDKADPRSAGVHQVAESLYRRSSYDADLGRAIAATQTVEPFFVPLDVQPRDSHHMSVKLALMDSRGEEYAPNADQNQSFLKPLASEIQELLQTFSHGISVIYVAPYSVGSGHDRDTASSNHGLLGVLDAYRKDRSMRDRDAHLFLLTKWDQYAPPMNQKRLFENPWPVDVDHVLRERYDRSWGEFQSLPLDGKAGHRRAFMQYTAGHFINGARSRPPELFASTYDRYSRTLMNWLYGNATLLDVSGQGQDLNIRGILFDEVLPEKVPRLSVSERAASILLKGSVRRPR